MKSAAQAFQTAPDDLHITLRHRLVFKTIIQIYSEVYFRDIRQQLTGVGFGMAACVYAIGK